jgi:hypothetical protein
MDNLALKAGDRSGRYGGGEGHAVDHTFLTIKHQFFEELLVYIGNWGL